MCYLYSWSWTLFVLCTYQRVYPQRQRAGWRYSWPASRSCSHSVSSLLAASSRLRRSRRLRVMSSPEARAQSHSMSSSSRSRWMSSSTGKVATDVCRGGRDAAAAAKGEMRAGVMGNLVGFSMGPCRKKQRPGARNCQRNSQAYSPEGSCISLLPAMDSRKHAAACQARGIKKAKGHGLASVVGSFEAPCGQQATKTGPMSRGSAAKIWT